MLRAGAVKARAVATPFTAKVRHAVGLRPLQATSEAKTAKAEKAALPTFKQYREKDGQFYFKLADAKGHVLLQSLGFTSPKDAGQAIARLKGEGYAACADLHALAPVASGVAEPDVEAALQALREAD
jgi:tryptophanyl-tRNA synthetase